MSLALDFRDEIEEVARRATPSHQPFGSVHRRGLFIGDFRCPQMGVDPLSLEDKNQFIGKGLPCTSKLGNSFCAGGAVMNRATKNQLLNSYLDLMEKAEQAPGWRESVRLFQDAAVLADEIRSLSRPEREAA